MKVQRYIEYYEERSRLVFDIDSALAARVVQCYQCNDPMSVRDAWVGMQDHSPQDVFVCEDCACGTD